MNATWSLVLGLLTRTLDTIIGDTVHFQQGSAVQKVLHVVTEVLGGAEIDPTPVHNQLQAMAATGRTPTPEDWAALHAVASSTLAGEAPPSPAG